VELAARDLVKRFPGVLALDGVSIDFRSHEIHAVVGENGAGKSTLMKILSGASRPDTGTLTVNGAPLQLDSPRQAQRHGIRMIHQELSLVPELTVAENILLGAERSRHGVIDRKAQDREARAVLVRLGQDALDVHQPVGQLSLAERQMTEIAKAMAQRAQLLILDEPTAILSQEETRTLFALLRQLRDADVAIAYISHRMDEVFDLADRVTVLRDGRTVSSAPIAEVSRSAVVRQMVGRELSEGFPAPVVEAGDEVLDVRDLHSGLARGVSFNLRRGEVVALVGLVGAGRTDVARAIFGASPITSGTLRLHGEPYRPRSPRDAIAARIGLLPEDRKSQALVLDGAVQSNTTLASLGEFSPGGVINRSRERAAVGRWLDTLGIRESSLDQPVRLLSGGNQQKVVLARWMLARSTLLLFDEPTRGIDVGAKAEIYALMRRLTADGAAILMISSELPEALGMADRVVVMRAGRSVGELSHEKATPDRVAALILGEPRAA
jgi:ribose transport system ATP-binding protein